LRAIEKFGKDEIKVVLTPMPVRDTDLNYFSKVANRCNGCLTVFPIPMKRGYHELQTGSTYGLMPSVYEPFGAAIEYMALGTVTIARATGGLKDQVDNGECGFLFKEDAYNYCWENIHTYNHTSQYVEARAENPWVINMVDRLYDTLKLATEVYRNQPDIYYHMIAAGFKKALSFDWDTNAEEYMQVYQKIKCGC
jgi:glycogen synthase